MPPKKAETWAERQTAIREILEEEFVRSQAELVEKLSCRGFQVTQSSVSRALSELRAGKIDGRYVLAGESAVPPPPGDELGELLSSIVRMRPAGPNLLVVSTPPGRAPALGLAIDAKNWAEVAGTIAGDDTIFIATAGRREQTIVRDRLSSPGKR